MMRKLLYFVPTSMLLAPLVLAPVLLTPRSRAAEVPPAAPAAQSSEDNAFAAGTRAMNEQRWPDALKDFDQVIASKSARRVDAALYWKAYLLMKMAHPAEASASCDALRTRFAASSWNRDCAALAVGAGAGVGAGTGTALSASGPGSDGDLKMLALNGLARQDPARAMPILRAMLAGDQPEELKRHALFALTQIRSPEAASLLQDAVNGKLGTPVQVDAIRSAALFEGKRGNTSFVAIYNGTQDEAVKQAILSALFLSNDAPRLVELARNEKNLEWKRSIVSQLALMHDKAATDYMLELLK